MKIIRIFQNMPLNLRRVDLSKKTLKQTIVRKFTNSLPSKYTEILIIIGPNTLEEAIEGALDVEVSQKIKE